MPILEIMVFINVGEYIGLFNTIFIIIITTVAGATILKMHGLSMLAQAQENIKLNAFPMETLYNGLCIFFAGVLLIIPGFITDMIGLLILFTPIRLLLKAFMIWFIKKLTNINLAHRSSYPTPDNEVIDGDYHDITNAQGTSYKELREKNQ